MKFAIVFAALFAFALAAQQQDAQVLKSDSEVNADGFHYILETSDGTLQQAQGQYKQVDKENGAVVQQGSFRYVADDGQTYETKWTADELGYHPEAAHLPVAPVA